MRVKNQITYLRQQQRPLDSSQEKLKIWHSQEDSFSFLLNTTDDEVPIYISESNFFLYSLIVPLKKLSDGYVDELLKWNLMVSSGYGYGYSFSNDDCVPFLCNPIEDVGSKTLDDSLPLFFRRYFCGYDSKETSYIEINQRISHVLEIHWVEEKSSWCTLNELGEVVPIAVRIQQDDLTLCTLRKKELDFYLFLNDACLVRLFDVSRSLDWGFSLCGKEHEEKWVKEKQEIYATRRIRGDPNKPLASYLRGFQIIRCEKPREEMMLKLRGEEPREYASFVILDWKHRIEQEWTSNPEQLGNYFVDSDYPYETSPAFFRSDVLSKYRQDPSRYKIHDRRIECKCGWSLRYDINEEGQVHVFICDLSHLPYKEQLYWKSFNESPKAGISQRSFETDFEGRWDNSYDPLRSLKKTLVQFPQHDDQGNPCPIWKIPEISETRDLTFLGYVVTESRKEWEDQILALSQIIVEGLNTSYINKLAETKGCRDKELGSIKQLGKIIENILSSPEDPKVIIDPLSELWRLRSSIVAHHGGNPPKGDLRKHFKELLTNCDSAMLKLSELVKTGCFEQN